MADFRDTTWTLHSTNGDPIVADGLNAATPTFTRGGSVTLPLDFWHESEVATEDYRQRYERALAFVAYNGSTATNSGTSYQGVPWYREDVPGDAPIESFVIQVEPGADVPVDGVWAIVTGGEDASRNVGGIRRLDVEMTILATVEEYETRTDLENALAEPVF